MGLTPEPAFSIITLDHFGKIEKSFLLGAADPLVDEFQLITGYDIKRASDGFILVGEIIDLNPPNNKDVLLAHIAPGAENFIWAKRIGRPGTFTKPLNQVANSVIATKDGGFAFVGQEIDTVTANKESMAFFVKTDADGNVTGMQRYGDLNILPFSAALANDIIELSDGRFLVIGGELFDNGIGGLDISAHVIRDDGSIDDWWAYGDVGEDIGVDVIRDSDGHYVVVGATENGGVSNVFCMKLADPGNSLIPNWMKTYTSGTNDYPTGIIEDHDGGYIISGYTEANGTVVNGGKNAFGFKIHKDGGVDATDNARLYGGAGDDFIYDMTKTADGFILAGETSSNGFFSSNENQFALRLNSEGYSSCNEEVFTFFSAGNAISDKSPDEGFLDANVFTDDNINIKFSPLLIEDTLVCEEEILQVFAGNDTFFCETGDVTLNAGFSGGEPAHMISWVPNYYIMNMGTLNPTVNPPVDTFYVLTVTDGSGTKESDTVWVDVLPSDSVWTGLDDKYCTSSTMSILSPNDPGGFFVGPGVNYGGGIWYFDPAEAGPGIHYITYAACEPNTKTTIVEPAPCIASVITDSSATSVTKPQGIFTDCKGQIYTTTQRNTIVKIDTLGVTSIIAGIDSVSGCVDGHVSVARLTQPIGLAVSKSGNEVFFADNGCHCVRMVRDDTVYTIAGQLGTAGDLSGVFGNTAEFDSPFGLTYDGTYTKLFVSEAKLGNKKIKEIDLANNAFVTDIIGGGALDVDGPRAAANAKLYDPNHIIANNDFLYITDKEKNVIYEYDFSTQIIDLKAGVYAAPAGDVDGHVSVARFRKPAGISINCASDLYIADAWNEKIRIISKDTVSTYPDPYFQIREPTDLSVFVKGFIDVANTGDNDILRLTIQDWVVGPWKGLDPDFTYCLGEDPDTLNPVYDCGQYFGDTNIIRESPKGSGKYVFYPSRRGTHVIGYDYQVGYCTERVFREINVVRNPFVDLPDSAGVCAPDQAFLQPRLVLPNNADFLWSTGETSRSINVGATGVYSLTVTTQAGCTDDDQIEVFAGAKPHIYFDPAMELCFGETAQLGNQPLSNNDIDSVAWSPDLYFLDSRFNENPNVLPPSGSVTTYTVYIRDVYSCDSTAQVNVTVNSVPVYSVVATEDTICNGDSTELSVNYLGPTTSIEWSDGQSGSPVTVNPGATTTYTVTLTNSDDCEGVEQIEIQVYPSFTPTITVAPATPFVCPGETVDLTANEGSGGTAPYDYAWNPGGSNPTGKTTSFNPMATDNYTVTVTDANNCTKTATTTVDVQPVNASVNPATIEFCENETASVSASPGGATYAWTPADAGLSDATAESPDVIGANLGAGTYSYTVTVTVGSCSDDAVLDVTVYPIPTAEVEFSDTTGCFGNALNLVGVPVAGGSYSWEKEGVEVGTSNTLNLPDIQHSDSGKYRYIVSVAGCGDDTLMNVSVNEVDIWFDKDTIYVCEGSSVPIVLNGDPGWIYSWTPSDSLDNPNIQNPVTFVQSNRIYSVIAIDDYFCSDEDSVQVLASIGLEAFAGDNDTICKF